MAKVGDVIILRIKHAPVSKRAIEIPGETHRVVKVASRSLYGLPTGYWPYPNAPFYACHGCGVEDYSELKHVQDRAQKYWRGLLPHKPGSVGHFADFNSSRAAFDAITGFRIRKSELSRKAI